jgi:phosphomannomutase
MFSNIVMFDLDGTLTPARKEMSDDIYESITALSEFAAIGIVTGSNWEYIQQQAPRFLDWALDSSASEVMIMPCNGTQLYTPSLNGTFERRHTVSMKDEIGAENYRRLVWILSNLQVNILEGIEMPVSGNFISYRGSLLNWCMIGRDATYEERDTFTAIDKKFQVRETVSSILADNLTEFGIKNIDHVIGGSTSIDIYPTGWDKRYALKHVQAPGRDAIYFMGDRCTLGGNDWPLYNIIDEDKRFMTGGPHETIEIIGGLIEKFKSDVGG